MKLYVTLLILSTLLVSAQVFATEKGVDVIYGEDNRLDVFESRNSAFVELSKSTAAMIAKENLKPSGSEIEITAKTLVDRGVCEKERFSKQIFAANCSGFLIAEDILVTAGHCIKTEADCKAGSKWVFDYKVDSSDQRNVTIPASSVYSCSKILSRSLDMSTKDDYAVIRLDRKTDRRPLSFRRSGKVSPGTNLVIIGHPTGLPTKIADGAKVRSLAPKFFVANLDSYGGNSGSAVFNVNTSEVEGILVRGEADYVPDAALGCKVSKKCANDSCRGEDVTFITNIPGINTL
ncbi:MAG TPA: serine protease [Bacteriovoracaceae bacterium]|nr:serine protease [Bacteriovoracaceae bacterium]